MNKPEDTLNTLDQETPVADKVLQLTIELAETADKKKSVVKGYNEEIKRIKAEIAALIKDDKETEDVV